MELTAKQQLALDKMLSGCNVFLSGDAGTGKTTVIRRYIQAAEAAGKNVLVCATTGIAADNIGYGAGTIHKILDIGVRLEDYRKRVRTRNPLLKVADVLIIDEISMCRTDLMDAVGRIVEAENNKRMDDRILGESSRENVQVILCGDFYQLPPVMTAADREALIVLYGSQYDKGGSNEHGYAYNSEYWQRLDLHGIYLDEVCRQQDKDYLYILSDIRNGINIRKAINYLMDNSAERIIADAPYLVPRNAEADRINASYLAKLDKDTEIMVTADITGHLTPADIKNINFAPRELVINIGARVMVTVNDPEGQYVNGTIGTITDIDIDNADPEEDHVCVKTSNNQKVTVYRYTREVERQVVEDVTKTVDGKPVTEAQVVREVVGIYSQIPVKLAWAISIHKSQGQTFGEVNIDPQCWEIGQFYAAISRATSLRGVHFLRPLKTCYVRAYPGKEKKKLEASLSEKM